MEIKTAYMTAIDAGKLNGMLSLCEDDVREEIVGAKLAEAKEEIERYRQGALLKDKVGNHPLDCYAIIFVGTECRLCQNII